MRLITDKLIVVLARNSDRHLRIIPYGTHRTRYFLPFNDTLGIHIQHSFVSIFRCDASLFGLGPYIIFQFQQKVKLQDAINHYVKNKMQEINLAAELVEANLVKIDTAKLTYQEKVEM